MDKVDVAQTAALWLRWFGLHDATAVEATRGQPAVRVSRAYAEARTAASPAALGAVQRLAGVASIRGAQPMMFCAAGYTRNAAAWADQAQMPLFSLELSDGQARPANVPAKFLFPPGPDWKDDQGTSDATGSVEP